MKDNEMQTAMQRTANREILPLLVPPRTAAKMLSLSEKTLYNLTRAGEIPVLRLERAVRYQVSDLESWISKKISENHVDNTAIVK